jgi:hypothetical protein
MSDEQTMDEMKENASEESKDLTSPTMRPTFRREEVRWIIFINCIFAFMIWKGSML